MPLTCEVTWFETRNDLVEATRKAIVHLLNGRLAEAIDLQLQAKQAHWNVKGPNFVRLHDLFDRVAQAASEYVDLSRASELRLGGVAEGTGQVVFRRSKLPEYDVTIGEWTAHVEAMRTVSNVREDVRGAIDDATELKRMPAPRTCLRRFLAESTSCSGWLKLTFRNEWAVYLLKIGTS